MIAVFACKLTSTAHSVPETAIIYCGRPKPGKQTSQSKRRRGRLSVDGLLPSGQYGPVTGHGRRGGPAPEREHQIRRCAGQSGVHRSGIVGGVRVAAQSRVVGQARVAGGSVHAPVVLRIPAVYGQVVGLPPGSGAGSLVDRDGPHRSIGVGTVDRGQQQVEAGSVPLGEGDVRIRPERVRGTGLLAGVVEQVGQP